MLRRFAGLLALRPTYDLPPFGSGQSLSLANTSLGTIER